MTKFVFTLFLVWLVVSTGCSPRDDSISEGGPYILVTDPWSRFLGSSPIVYHLPKMADGMRSILHEQQLLVSRVLGADGKSGEGQEFSRLAGRLEVLKSRIPSPKTESGWERHGHQFVSKTSSPALARSVENLVSNASLTDLGQRIDGLNQLISGWSKKVELMSLRGVEGVIRRANLAYLKSLRHYADDFVNLQKSLEKVEEQASMVEATRNLHLQQWAHFEETRLPLLHDYVQNEFSHQLVSHEDGSYMLPSHMEQDLFILACTIGGRVLYFELFQEEDGRHPFRLVYIGD